MPKRKGKESKEIRIKSADDVMALLASGEAPMEQVVTSVELVEAQDAFAEAMEPLTDKERQFLYLVDVKGLSSNKAAIELGYTGTSMSSKINFRPRVKKARKSFARMAALQFGITKAYVRKGLIRAYDSVSDPDSELFSGAATAGISKVINVMEGHNAGSTGDRATTIININTGIRRDPVEAIEGEITKTNQIEDWNRGDNR